MSDKRKPPQQMPWDAQETSKYFGAYNAPRTTNPAIDNIQRKYITDSITLIEEDFDESNLSLGYEQLRKTQKNISSKYFEKHAQSRNNLLEPSEEKIHTSNYFQSDCFEDYEEPSPTKGIEAYHLSQQKQEPLPHNSYRSKILEALLKKGKVPTPKNGKRSSDEKHRSVIGKLELIRL